MKKMLHGAASFYCKWEKIPCKNNDFVVIIKNKKYDFALKP